MTSVVDILNAISDEQTLLLFKIVARGDGYNSATIKMKSKLTRKQYYSRISRLTKADLVKRKSGKYFLSTYGRIVFNAQAIIETALDSYWKLKALDSLETFEKISKDEHVKIVDSLIDNQQIREILLKRPIAKN